MQSKSYKYKKIGLTSYILSDQNGIRPELNNKRNSRKYSKTWILNNTLLNDHWVIGKIMEEIKVFQQSNKSKSN
jgi:hypothetical protein